jgi:lysophospholipase L1-like esterase
MHLRPPLPRWWHRPARPRGRAAAAAALLPVTALAILAAVVLAGWAGGEPGPARAALSRPAAGHTAQPPRIAGSRAGAGAARPAQPRTSCRSVAHIGDSTSVGLTDPAVLPAPAQRIQARYAAVGVRHILVDASGGRSIVEEMPGQLNGYLAARAIAGRGFRGCWVIALGTNDAANIAAGSASGPASRISRMMSVTGGQPVLWVNVTTLDAAGPWARPGMQAWNSALRQACASHPALRIFDWASVARPAWFAADGIHYTSAGYAARGRAIAGALATAFPASGHSRGCVIR